MSQQVERTLDIIELLVERTDGLALGRIADDLDLPKSAAHRLLSHLLERGYVEQIPDTQHYRLTMRLAVLGCRQLAGSGLGDVCQPALDDLAARTGELARIAVVDGDGLTWVAQAQGARYGLRYDGNLGRRVRLSATANGKAWLVTMTDEAAIALVLEQGFGEPDELGRKAIREVPGLTQALARTRRDGFGTAFEEGEPGMAAVASAIAGPRAGDPCVGTVSVAGPTVRLTRAALRAVAPQVRATALRLAELWPIRRLQGAAPPGGVAQRETA